MTFVDWIRNSRGAISEQGLDGVPVAAAEFYRGVVRRARRRARRFHWLTPDTRTLDVRDHSVTIQQRTVGEFDHVQAFRNERPMLADLADSIGPGDVFWDVGANVGTYSLFASAAGAEAVAFEPFPENATAIRENAALNGADEVSVCELALSDEAGEHRLALDPRECAGGGRGSLLDDWTDGTTTIDVQCVSGDEAIADLGVEPPSVVKIDVEGAERRVLRGLAGTLERGDCRAVYCELHHVEDEAVRELLRDQGFTIDVPADATTAGVLGATR